MSDNPYSRMIDEGPLSDAVDKAVAEVNAAFVEDDFDRKMDEENAARWASIWTAQGAVGEHGVVLPLATARVIIAALRGEATSNQVLTPDLLASMVQSEVDRAEKAAEEES